MQGYHFARPVGAVEAREIAHERFLGDRREQARSLATGTRG